MATRKRERRKLDDYCVTRVVQEIAAIVDGEFEGNRTRAAEALDMTQPHLSNILNNKRSKRGPGIVTLLRLREKTGRSIDSLLGLEPTPAEGIVSRLQATIELEVARERKKAVDEARAAERKSQELERKLQELAAATSPQEPLEPRRRARKASAK